MLFLHISIHPPSHLNRFTSPMSVVRICQLGGAEKEQEEENTNHGIQLCRLYVTVVPIMSNIPTEFGALILAGIIISSLA